jgi:hypothetical protein
MEPVGDSFLLRILYEDLIDAQGAADARMMLGRRRVRGSSSVTFVSMSAGISSPGR